MLIRHSIIYFIGKVAPAILSVVGVMIYTRLVGPEDYGLFSLITVITGLVNILFFQWIRSSFIRFYNDRDNVESFLGSILKSHIVTLIILSIPTIIAIVIFYLKSLNPIYVFIGYILVVMLSIFEMFIIYFRTILKPTIITNISVVQSLLVIIVSTILIYFGSGVLGLLFGTIVGSLIGIILFFKNVDKSKKNNLSIKSNTVTQKTFLKYGLPITLSFVLSVALQNIDKIMISSILGLEANGNYAVSYDLIHNLIYMIMMSLSLASFPLILKVIKEKGGAAGKEQFIDYSKLLLFISIPACFGLASVLPEFTSIIIGKEFSISNKLMNLIILASLFHGLKSYYFDLTLQISAKTKYFFIPALTAMILNVILNSYMLNKYGIEGAALATTVSFFVAMLISAFYSRRSYPLKFPLLDFTKILASSLLMYIIIINIAIENHFLSLIVKVLMGIFVYALVSILVNSLNVRQLVMNKVMKR